jgi:serine/threonine-protein kinase
MLVGMAAPDPGTVLAGKYRVDRVLGEGGMGVVVAATDLQLERRVAIKFLLPDYAQHHEASQRFLREARAAVKIQSEHVARVIDVGTMDGGAPYMVMEFLEGRDLAALIDELTVLPVDEAVAHVLEACDAIAEAHSVGIVHRDLKPANLFLARQPDGSSRIKVLDFGISKAMMTNTTGIDPSLTRTSSMMGSPLYMSPEQMKSAKHVDPRTDVWALGVILYELLTGKPPFYAESIPELSAKVLLEEPESIRATRSDVPEALEAAVKRALAKEPAARFPTVADFAHALAPFGPARTRTNVERASRVLKISGLTVPMGEPAPGALAPEKTAAYARTAAAWTDSSGGTKKEEPAKKASPATIGAIAVAVVAVAAAIFVMVGKGSGAPPAGPSAATPPVPAPTAAPVAPTPTAVAPEKTEPAPAPTNAMNVVPTLQSAEPAATTNTAAAPPPAVQVASAKAHTKPAAPSAKPKTAAPGSSPDPFSGFGSRK